MMMTRRCGAADAGAGSAPLEGCVSDAGLSAVALSPDARPLALREFLRRGAGRVRGAAAGFSVSVFGSVSEVSVGFDSAASASEGFGFGAGAVPRARPAGRVDLLLRRVAVERVAGLSTAGVG
jgi:hypothetical protein